jgi:ribonuclease Z
VSLRHLGLSTSWGPLRLAGGSRAGDGTILVLPQLGLALDAGRPHRAVPPLPTVMVSHGHLDHIGGLTYWASQRFLNSMPGGTAVVPAAIAADVRALLEITAHLEGGRPYDVTVVEADDGTRHRLRRDLELELFATDHWVPTLGSSLIWYRRHLRPDLAGLSEREIAARSAAGETVTTEDEVRLLTYCADTGPGLFARHPEVLDAEVLLLECTFYRTGDRDRAAAFGHLHVDDLLAAAPRFTCRHLVLLHPSRRHRLREVDQELQRRIRPAFACQVHPLWVDWE